ncbi:DUF7522 family protein [Halorientalis pallida]|uniref:Uncharacterized protein n=1 Tax=Halorientalis pallida TaxID=2479928 RepID=A0A498L0Q0_9EURY|nr:hypothetical protein [Halorientalis pallida]RXK51899.1 hypothetical protein EAF64_04500 [Halorientalis pallida]
MPAGITNTGIDDERGDGIVSVSRTTLGDTLRSVVYFTPAAFDILYVRQDLDESTEAARPTKEQLVEFERLGFAERPVRTAISTSEPVAGIGSYEFTVRFHEDGFVCRVIEGNAGVVLTTDAMDVDAFEDVVTAIRRLLSGTATSPSA